VDELWEDMPEPSRLIADGDRIGPFTVMHTPGHTPGSLCLYDEAEGFLFSGDTLFSRGVGRTDLIGGDGEALARSLDRLLALPDRVRVFPGHGSQTRIADERW
jgi:glyoxylase-like metal-dependent hydrolase (beta-lactamase superfamily II)